MSDLAELYQAVILDHSKHPRHRGRLPTANRVARSENPTCGDECTVYLEVHDGHICAIGFTGAGCAISQASASLMTTLVQGKTFAEVSDLFAHFRHIVTTGEHPVERTDIAAFAGVHAYPSRIKCATLAWHATLDALGENT